ncbi:probable purine permease 10 [Ipomoea triloba]|uniref:probable purine permease 10 n=1 Tax=Ipomoea triloba TaxID=35885 RepID=UPI00125D6D3C|nr:probable purine permease 10 [Ipomoea triloba]XP_031130420.1 probable purine permease 10 [Ipomoea triloba]
MGEVEERLLDITSCDEFEETKENNQGSKSSGVGQNDWKRWLQVAFFTFSTLAGIVASTLLGRVYYDQGGKSKWLVAALQTAGFPILVPFLVISSPKTPDQEARNPPSLVVLASIYIVLGVVLAAAGILYSVAIEYIPASTYTLVNSSQLAFNALFSLFLNAQKFSPYIINSVVLLTFSPLLLIFGQDSGESEVMGNENYVLGILFTLAASAFPALLFSLTQLAFEKVIRSENVKDVIEMTIFQSLVATLVTLVGLVITGEWATLNQEMLDYKLGVFSYVLVLVWTAISCQCYTFGAVALTFKVSSLFSNVVIRLGTPIIPFLSVIFLGEEMNGLKVMALGLALWGFASYIYQHYLDEKEANNNNNGSVGDEAQDSTEQLKISAF